jgi:hypothetical protein
MSDENIPVIEDAVVVEAAESVVEAAESVVEAAVPEPEPEPVVEAAVPEPEPEPEPEPVVEEPVVEEPIAEPIAEPVVEAAEAVPEPEPVVEAAEAIPVDEPIAEPVVEAAEAVPVPEPEPEPVVEEPQPEPVVEAPTVEEPITMVVGEVSNIIPKIIFIVPYRDREEQLRFFEFQMKTILEDYQPGETFILYSHQADQRSFNRGAMKNIGFLYVKSRFPNDYQNITLVFNDVDTMPYTKGFINYETTLGKVKHFYGYTFTLGGIVSIKAADFEKTNGFPNYWAWGYEDNAFQRRVEQTGLQIDRSQFYPILDKNILQLKDGITRVVNRGEYDRYVDEVKYQNNQDGIRTLSFVNYTFVKSSRFINVHSFQTPVQEQPELSKVHDMREGPVPFQRTPQQKRGRPLMRMMF